MRYIILFFLLSLNNLFITYAQQFNVATYNIRYENKGDEKNGNGWKQRGPVVCQLIQFHDFDIFGSQEVLKSQLDAMLNAMPEYDYIGVGRDDGKDKGEFSPIFYKRSLFNLLDFGTFWLSEKTDRPNTGWDASLPRVCTWGKFEMKEGCRSFWLFNLHLDHRGVVARQESAKLVLDRILSMCNGEPVILMGDFNITQLDESYIMLNTSGILKDVYDTAEIRYALNGTSNNFNPNLISDKRIDHIFITNHFKAKRYGVLTDTYRSTPGNTEEFNSSNFPVEVTMKESQARLPSDHFPVMTTLVFEQK